MAWSQTEICNVAIARLGETKQISSIDDAGRAPTMCKLHYAEVLQMALARGDWNFARKRDTLVEEVGTPPEEWAYQYQRPADCLAERRIVDGRQVVQVGSILPFTQEWNATSAKRLIYTDVKDAELIYTYDVTNEALFDPFFADYFAWWLALEIALPVTGQRAKRNDAAEGRRAAWAYALAHNVVTDPTQWLGMIPGPAGLHTTPTLAARQ